MRWYYCRNKICYIKIKTSIIEQHFACTNIFFITLLDSYLAWKLKWAKYSPALPCNVSYESRIIILDVKFGMQIFQFGFRPNCTGNLSIELTIGSHYFITRINPSRNFIKSELVFIYIGASILITYLHRESRSCRNLYSSKWNKLILPIITQRTWNLIH